MNDITESENSPPVNWDELAQKVDLLACMDAPEPATRIFMGLIEGTVGALVAQGGLGKTYVALEIALAVAGGPNILQLDIGCTGSVLALLAEDPLKLVNQRIHHIQAGMSPDEVQRISENFEVQCLFGHSPDLFDDGFRLWLRKKAEGRRLVILDTLRRFHVRDENNGGDMVKLLGILEGICHETGCSILFVHHTGKSAALNDQGALQQASRGSSVLVDNIRGGQVNLVGMTSSEAKKFGVSEEMRGFYLKFCSAKQNYGPPTADRWFGRGDGGVLLPVTFEERTDGKDSSKARTKSKPQQSKRGHG